MKKNATVIPDFRKRGKQKTAKKGAKPQKTRQNDQSVALSAKKRKAPAYVYDAESNYLTEAESEKFFSGIRRLRDKALFQVIYHRGLRAHEAGLLQMSDLNMKDGTLFVRRGKNSFQRTYRLLPIELHALTIWLRERGKQAGPIFPSQKGARPGKLGISRSQVWRLFQYYCGKAGIRLEKSHPHALKHTCATRLAENNNPADLIQDWLGHKSARSTDIYMHFSQKRRDQAWASNRDWKY